ncbi:hypothetical protein GGR58DRAFT_141790 [Xylaria digitata]|nr:hypothetical protein GGR58DRAFT_141790 [Xylaria digitata]
MCCSWLNAINIPVRKLNNAVAATKYSQGTAIPEDAIGILDGDDEYDVYQDEDGHFGSTQSVTQVDNSHGEFTCGQQLSSASSVCLAPAQKRHSYTVERSENGTTIIIRPRWEVVGPEAQETRLITELSTTNDRAKLARLTTELLELLQSRENLTGGALEGVDDDAISTISFAAAEERAEREREEERLLEQQRVEMARIKEQREKEQQEVLKKAALQARIETEAKARIKEQEEKELQEALERVALQVKGEEQAKVRRKTPPHLRGIRGGRRS